MPFVFDNVYGVVESSVRYVLVRYPFGMRIIPAHPTDDDPDSPPVIAAGSIGAIYAAERLLEDSPAC